MPPKDYFIWQFEIAERLRLDAARAPEPRKGRLLKLAHMHDIEPALVSGSIRAIAESREIIGKANKLLGM